MSEASQTPKSLKAQITRTSLVLAAAAILREEGPKAVTYRKVAKWAGAASSSVGYYFDSAAQLLYEAGRYNIQLWSERAEKVALAAEAMSPAQCRANAVELLVRGCLPDESVALPAHYAQLIAAAESEAVTDAYRKGRAALDDAIERVLARANINMPARLVGTVVDGAAVAAVSEGHDVRELASEMLRATIDAFIAAQKG